MADAPFRDLHLGDCKTVLPSLGIKVDAVVTDPPLEFMGRGWDYDIPSISLWRTVLGILKPGGHALIFGGTRTYHRLVCNVEDAGFEVRDQIQWMFGTGFPKSLDISKAMDKAAGVEREVIGRGRSGQNAGMQDLGPSGIKGGDYDITAPATYISKKWEGWGTGLKPAHEPILLARKPLDERTVAENVEAHGTGGLNIGACRVGDEVLPEMLAGQARLGTFERYDMVTPERIGRFPANVIHDGSEEVTDLLPIGTDRFFYCAKASGFERGDANNHPTVKPIALMRYLCRLITPPGGVVLDPFMGSGSTGIAAAREGFSFIGVEREEAYLTLARERIERATS